MAEVCHLLSSALVRPCSNLPIVSKYSIIITGTMNNKHRKVLEKIFQNPVKPIEWQDIEKLFLALGASIAEGNGSRVTFSLNGVTADFHRPHPGKEAKRYQIIDTREFLTKAGIDPKKV